jgi:dihydrofolate synthase/folylpolyglutamate synthase
LGELQANAIRLPLLGEHSVGNTALAVACCSLLKGFDSPALVRAIRTGCANARLPGRVEVLQRAPWVIADAAHTAASARALAETLERIPAQRSQLVLSVSRTENLALICEALLPRFQTVTVTSAEPTRSLSAQALAAFIATRFPAAKLRVVADPVEALQRAFRTLAPDALLCATGSVYMAGIARATLAADAEP